MSLFLGDLRIKAAITLGLEDISKNDWLLDDILGDIASNDYLTKIYGNQVDSCRQWLKNNRINILMSLREDRVEFPAIVIEVGSSNEKAEMKHLADLSTETQTFTPNQINRPIPYVIKPTSGSYEPISGVFTYSAPQALAAVVTGMVLVDPATGNGYIVQSILSDTQIQLLTGLSLTASTYGVIPQYQYYESRVGHTFMQEEYNITCHALDQQTNLWLHSIVAYLLLRYRQPLFEADGFAESIIKSGKMYPNPNYSDAGQVIWSRDITLSGQVENRWIVQPHRIIEDIAFPGPLRILSNTSDNFEDLSTVNWAALQDEAYRNG